jgi:hypothetical protein
MNKENDAWSGTTWACRPRRQGHTSYFKRIMRSPKNPRPSLVSCDRSTWSYVPVRSVSLASACAMQAASQSRPPSRSGPPGRPSPQRPLVRESPCMTFPVRTANVRFFLLVSQWNCFCIRHHRCSKRPASPRIPSVPIPIVAAARPHG